MQSCHADFYIILNIKNKKHVKTLKIAAIRKQRRPLDRSFHAACVAIGLMHYYYTLKDEKKAASFIEPVKESLNELQKKTKYMGERGIYTLEQMIKFIDTLDYSSIDQTLKLR